MSRTIDELLSDSLKIKSEPSPSLNRLILRRCKMKEDTMKNTLKRRIAAAVCVCILTAGSVSAYAAYRFLNPVQIAEKVDNISLRNAFDSDEAIQINETQQSNGYSITLLGLVSGAHLESYVPSDRKGEIEKKKTYAAFAITIEDEAKTRPDNLCVSALISGVKVSEFNNSNMNGGLTWFKEDGVVYALYACDDLEIFADRGVYLGVVDQFGNEMSAFQMDSESGAYRKVETYDGTNALFKLPLDEALGDPAKAEKYLEDVRGKEETQVAETQRGENFPADSLDPFIDSLTLENVDKYFVRNEDTVLTASVDENGWIEFGTYYDNELGDYVNGPSGYIRYLIEEDETFAVNGFGISDNDITSLTISAICKNENGSYSSATYSLREDVEPSSLLLD